LRRLLAFGTGAAIVGIVLLVVAFYEAYLIVGSLQNQLAANTVTDTNALLEAATLEAVFLGVMAAVGYGLIAKGLDGIRRQELLEMEGPAQDDFGRAVNRRPNSDRPRYVLRAAPDKVRVAQRPQPQYQATHPGIKQSEGNPPEPAVRTAPVAASAVKLSAPVISPPPSVPAAAVAVAPPASPPVAQCKVPPPPPDAAQPVIVLPPPAQVETPPVVAAKTGPSEIPESTTQTTGTTVDEAPIGEVVWESGEPAKVEGVDLLPELQAQKVDAAASCEPDQQGAEWAVPGQAESGPGQPVKRGRGRPKGSKSQKKVPEQNPQPNPQENPQ